MKTLNISLSAAAFGLVLALSGCADSRAKESDADAKVRVEENGGIDIQAPGVDVQIDPSGVKLNVDSDDDKKNR